jgi:hypothetical protein
MRDFGNKTAKLWNAANKAGPLSRSMSEAAWDAASTARSPDPRQQGPESQGLRPNMKSAGNFRKKLSQQAPLPIQMKGMSAANTQRLNNFVDGGLQDVQQRTIDAGDYKNDAAQVLGRSPALEAAEANQMVGARILSGVGEDSRPQPSSRGHMQGQKIMSRKAAKSYGAMLASHKGITNDMAAQRSMPKSNFFLAHGQRRRITIRDAADMKKRSTAQPKQ